MAKKNEPGEKIRCVRCGLELSEGTRYCVGCGISYEDEVYGKQAAIEGELHRRKDQREMNTIFYQLRRLFRIFGR